MTILDRLARWHGLAYAKCQRLFSRGYADVGTVGTDPRANTPKKPNKNNGWHVGTVGTPYGGVLAGAKHHPHPVGDARAQFPNCDCEPASTILSAIVPHTRCAICCDKLSDGWRIIEAHGERIPVCAGCASRRVAA